MIRVESAYDAIATLLQMYDDMKPKPVGIEQPSYISDSATIGEKPYIGAFAYIGRGAKIGNNVKIYPQAYIGDGVVIGDNTIIYAGVKIYTGCVVGKSCILHAGVVLGADGFGFAPEGDHYKKIPQIGNVLLEDDVEIGANTCIDRATMGSTIIKKGVKLDNLVQIAHNVVGGGNTVIAAPVSYTHLDVYKRQFIPPVHEGNDVGGRVPASQLDVLFYGGRVNVRDDKTFRNVEPICPVRLVE